MVAHCLYRTVFVVGAVLARLVLLLAWLVHFLLGWCHFLLWQAAKPSGDKCTPPKSAPPKVTTGCPSLLLMHRARLLKSLREHLRGT
jgi:hypothetical protein